MLTGSWVALVTPLQDDGRSIAWKHFEDLIKWHISQGTQGMVIAGTTGESPTLTPAERAEMIERAVSAIDGRIPCYVGTGTNNTDTTISHTEMAQSLGADGAMVVTPYYNKPTQDGLLAHYKAVATSTSLPLLLYNVPGRTQCDLLPETIGTLAKIKNIVGIKDATGSLQRLTDTQQYIPRNFALFSGDDHSAAEFLLAGGHGVISVTANVLPRAMRHLCDIATPGNSVETKSFALTLEALNHALFAHPNPMPIKSLMHGLGLIPQGIRLPLLPLSQEQQESLITLYKTSLEASKRRTTTCEASSL